MTKRAHLTNANTHTHTYNIHNLYYAQKYEKTQAKIILHAYIIIILAQIYLHF